MKNKWTSSAEAEPEIGHIVEISCADDKVYIGYRIMPGQFPFSLYRALAPVPRVLNNVLGWRIYKPEP